MRIYSPSQCSTTDYININLLSVRTLLYLLYIYFRIISFNIEKHSSTYLNSKPVDVGIGIMCSTGPQSCAECLTVWIEAVREWRRFSGPIRSIQVRTTQHNNICFFFFVVPRIFDLFRFRKHLTVESERYYLYAYNTFMLNPLISLRTEKQ